MLKNTKITALIAIAVLVFTGLACNFNLGGEKAELPSDAEMQSLVQKTTADFADAVEKGDFAEFLKTTSKDFQEQFPNDKMKTSFAVFTDKKDEVVPVLREAAKNKPKFSPAPSLREENGTSVVDTKGTLETDSSPVKFDCSYERESGSWKLISVKYEL